MPRCAVTMARWFCIAAAAATAIAEEGGSPAPAPLLVKARTRPDAPWKEYPTRTLDHLPPVPTDAAGLHLSKFGGRLDRTSRATGFFRVEKIGPRWWLVDPEGGLFIHVGVASVTPGRSEAVQRALKEKFGDESAWADATTQVLRQAGFNGTGAWSAAASLRAAKTPLAYTLIWNFMSTFGKTKNIVTQKPGHAGYPADCIPVFHPEFAAFCDSHARALQATRDDPWLVGHFSDNELPCPPDLLDRCLNLKPDDPHMGHNRRAAEQWLTRRRGGAAGTAPPSTDEREAFRGYVFERYYEITTGAIRRNDPNHLCLGSRLYGSEKSSEAVFRAAGKYLDAVAVNYYGVWTPDARTLDRWTKWSGRPVMITEFYTKGEDSGMKNSTGAGWIVPTQADRGAFYQNYVLALLESGTCVGWHWFKYMDNDPADLSTDPSNRDSNKGIVTIRFEPYGPLLDRMRALNTRIYALADFFDASRREEPR